MTVRMDHVGIDVEDRVRPAMSDRLGPGNVSFEVDDLDEVLGRLRALGYGPVGPVENCQDVHRLCYVDGPEGIIVMLAEDLRGSA